jgi:hypothetical protein
MNQGRSSLQSIEQKMRMELRPQVLDLSLRKVCFKLGSAQLALSGLVVDAVEVRGTKEEPVRDKTNLQMLPKVVRDHGFERILLAEMKPCDIRLRGEAEYSSRAR